MFVIRRIAGHVRLDRKVWTFVFFSDRYVDLRGANYIKDSPSNVQSPLLMWMSESLTEDTPGVLFDNLSRDGFGFVLRVLREIKTTWKLLLHEMGVSCSLWYQYPPCVPQIQQPMVDIRPTE